MILSYGKRYGFKSAAAVWNLILRLIDLENGSKGGVESLLSLSGNIFTILKKKWGDLEEIERDIYICYDFHNIRWLICEKEKV